MRTPNFFDELKRRNVVRMAGLYLVGAWLLVQVAGTLLPVFDAPAWVMKTLVAVLAAGLIPALIFSWVFELTPAGLKRDEDVRPEESIAPQTARRMNRMITAVLVLALGYFAVDKFVLAPKREAVRSRATLSPNERQPAFSAKSIAVLPFENLSDDKNAAYFADGIQDEILTKLAGIAELKVISRTSTAKYKSKPEDLKTVSQQLGVATVLEGSVQKAAGKVRVIVQLIDTRSDSHLWARTYDRDLADVFAIQSEVAQEIADSLQAKLSPTEANTMASAPTKDPAAYDLFLKGEYEQRAALNAQTGELFDQAITWYKEAIARDPHFALAMAQLVICRLRRHWLVEPLTDSELGDIGRTANDALALAPGLAEAHVALGVFHYYGFRQYEPALAEFQRAIELQPNNSEALQFIAYVYRRQGQWERALEGLERSLQRDPRNASTAGNIAQTYCLMRRWKEAESTARRALAIDPHEATSMTALLFCSLNRDGNTQEALRVLATFPADELLIANSGSFNLVVGSRTETLIFSRNFDAALKVWETGPGSTSGERQRLSATTIIRVLAGDLSHAAADADKARVLLEARLLDRPGELRSMRALSWVYLGLKRNADAVKIAQQALELLPPEKDAVLGTANLVSLAEMQARSGATSEAVRNLRRLLSLPAGEMASIARLKACPVWDPIRNDPGFQQLLTLKEHVGP